MTEHAAWLHRIADEIDRRREDFLAAEIADTAKPVSQASTLDIPRGAEATTMGPLISAEHRDKVLAYYALARDEGAEVLVGGGVPRFGDARDNVGREGGVHSLNFYSELTNVCVRIDTEETAA